MTRCLLWGASGFLGRAVHDRLATDHRYVLLTAGRRAGPGVDLGLDLATAGPDRVAGALTATGVDVVVNCAGATGADPARLVADNVVAVATLCEAARRSGRTVRLIHIGSAAEYGATRTGGTARESDPARPVSPYGISKLAGTSLVLAAAAQGLPALVLRVFNPVGPGTPETLLPGRLVAEMIRSAADGVPATVGPLGAHRDLIDARDVAEAVAAAVRAIAVTSTAGDLPPLLNVGSGRATALRDLAALVAAEAGTAPPLENADGSARSAAVNWQRADLTMVGSALGWQPRIPLADSVRDMWRAAAGSVPR